MELEAIFRACCDDFNLEGKSPTQAIEKEKRLLRSITRAVVPCDISQDPPIADGFGGPYDAVMYDIMLSIEAGCHMNIMVLSNEYVN